MNEGTHSPAPLNREILPALLQEAVSAGILDVDGVLDCIMKNKREQVSRLHRYAISPPSEAGGRWQTSYKGPDGKRKNIKARTREELLDKLVPLYLSDSHIDKLTFHGLFLEWLDYKQEVTDSPNTIRRHEQHYRKYLEPSSLHGKRIRQIDELSLESECNRIIRESSLSRKE